MFGYKVGDSLKQHFLLVFVQIDPELLKCFDGAIVRRIIATDVLFWRRGWALLLKQAWEPPVPRAPTCRVPLARTVVPFLHGQQKVSSALEPLDCHLLLLNFFPWMNVFRCAHLKLCKNPIFQFGDFLSGLAAGFNLDDRSSDGPGCTVGTTLAQDNRASGKPRPFYNRAGILK